MSTQEMTRRERSRRLMDLARTARRIAETPAEVGGAHAAAQSVLAGIAAEMADLIIALFAESAAALLAAMEEPAEEGTS